MVSPFEMTRRQIRLRLSIRKIKRGLLEAQNISDMVRLRTMHARDVFESERGIRALPNADSPAEIDRELITAVAIYNDVRRRLDLPLNEARKRWMEFDVERESSTSLQNFLSCFLPTKKAKQYVKSLDLTEANCAEVLRIVEGSIVPQFAHFQDLDERKKDFTQNALVQYQANNAAFVASLERLNLVASPNGGPPRRGLHGGLPEEIALDVEEFELHQGPLVAILRRYQEFGARYIAVQKRTLLGDDMGLGKTVQVLAAMCHLYAEGARHFLVVAPNSVLMNWEREVAKHTELRPIVVHGSDRAASVMEWQALGGVAITTYGTLPKILDLIPSIDLLAVDEAHFAKNPNALRTQAVQQVASRSSHVVLMTGTALENRLDELNFLVVLAQPEMEPVIGTMMSASSQVVLPETVVRALAPVYLRRTQDDVLHELPERIVTDEWIQLSDEDRVAYRDGSPELMGKRLLATRGNGSRSSAKYERFLEIVDEHKKANRKIVVFSFFRQVIDDVCALVGGAPQITGSTSSTERQRIIDSFASDPLQHVLVLQVDAGGVGINLQCAQVVILMEAQFKPSTEWQAIARVHRMGQSRTVNVHRLLARNTIEERLVEIIETKSQLFAAYAHDSSVRDASEMAIDPQGHELESELRRLLDEGRDER